MGALSRQLPRRLIDGWMPCRSSTARYGPAAYCPGSSGRRNTAYVIRTPADGVGRGFSGIGNADRLKRHESRRRTMAHVADHLSFATLADLERAVADRCRVLDGHQLSLGTTFHWWPKSAKPA